MVLLSNSRLMFFPDKLNSTWLKPFNVMKPFSNGAVKVWTDESSSFKVNG